MSGTAVLIGLSLLVQFVVERLKVFKYPEDSSSWLIPVIAMILSMVLTISCRIGILAVYGITIDYPIIDYLLTGLILSGGSTLINELIKSLQGLKEAFQSNK